MTETFTETEPDIMTVTEVAELLGVSKDTVRNTMRRWGVPHYEGYLRSDVVRAKANAPGRGARTDLQKAPADRPAP